MKKNRSGKFETNGPIFLNKPVQSYVTDCTSLLKFTQTIGYISVPKKIAFISNLLVPYQNALKFVLSVNSITSPRPSLSCLNGTVPASESRFGLLIYPLSKGFSV